MRKIPEEKKSKFGKFLGMFKGKEKTEVKPVLEEPEIEVEEMPEFEEKESPEKPKEESVETEVEKTPEEMQKEEEEKLKEAEKEKRKKEAEELKKRYGVIKEIPERRVEEEYIEKPEGVREEFEAETDIPALLLRMEKIDGKLEILDRSRDDMTERIMQLAGEIGELRTMIMERERSFDEIKSDFEKVKDTVSGLEPIRIKRDFERRKMEILENKAKIEQLETLVKALGEESKKFRELMEKIKSFENIINISYDIDRKVSEINEIKDYASKVGSKVESIFSELNAKVSELESQREKIEKLDELTVEITKMLDEISVRFTRFVEEKDLKDFKKTIEEDVKKMLESKAPVVKIKGDQVIQDQISQLSTRLLKLKSVVESQNTVINNIIDYLSGGEATPAEA
ncbi:MAG: hypothetical protein QMD36_05090 [Candidatus Aenigmarchaeota archaeon]|nr:hypothetical protein [Candidatus Aenigmarchaeota archaeon]